MENLLVQAFGAIGVGMSLATIEEIVDGHPLSILADIIAGANPNAAPADHSAFN